MPSKVQIKKIFSDILKIFLLSLSNKFISGNKLTFQIREKVRALIYLHFYLFIIYVISYWKDLQTTLMIFH